MTPSVVSVRTGARLHFGPLSYRPETGRHFGGIGMMVEHPGVHLNLQFPSPQETQNPVTDASIGSARAKTLLTEFLPRYALPESIKLTVFSEILPHSGLGSGTQLALALQEGLQTLTGSICSPEELARQGGRGERSAIGVYGYLLGGFVVDAGHASGDELGEIACRLNTPESWRVVLLHPQGQTGLHGPEEIKAFRSLPAMPETVTGQLCRLTLTELLPALRSGAFSRFTEALFEYGQRVGEFFAPTQGGAFASPVLRELCRLIPKIEQTGMAQSSWGPTVALFAENDDHARDLEARVQRLLPTGSVHIRITSPRNTGRSLTTDPDSENSNQS